MAGTPHYAGNNVVLAGSMCGSSLLTGASVESMIVEMYKVFHHHNETLVLCGFNLAFDLGYMLRYPSFVNMLKKNMDRIAIWDVQQAQYLLSGQTMTYPSLDECAKLYGLPTKPDKIKQYWDSGVRTEDIPIEELDEYLRHDVLTTHTIAQKQAKLMSKEMKTLCFVKGDDILCSAIMERNGMHFNLEHSNEIACEIREQLMTVLNTLNDLVISETGFQYFQPSKNAEIATMLFGGEFKWEVQVEAGVFKTGMKKGQTKYKKELRSINYSGILSEVVAKQVREKYNSGVGDDVLQYILDNEHPDNWAVGEFVGSIQLYRELSKDLSTYYDGYSKLVWEDGMLRPSFQNCSTTTGRQSCTKPNLQNTSKGE
jgi:hypothetical protein